MTYPREGTYTIGVVYETTPFVYYFAMYDPYKKVAVGGSIEVTSIRGTSYVKVVSIEEGINPNVERWRSGGKITLEQKLANPYKPKKGETLVSDKLPSPSELVAAIKTIAKLNEAVKTKISYVQGMFNTHVAGVGILKPDIIDEGDIELYYRKLMSLGLVRDKEKERLQKQLARVEEEMMKLRDKIQSLE